MITPELTLSLVRHDGNKVIRNYCQVVSVDRKRLKGAGTGIDKSQTMLLALLELELGEPGIADAWSVVASRFQRTVEVVATVDESIDGGNSHDIEVRVENGRVDVGVVPVVVVREQERAEI